MALDYDIGCIVVDNFSELTLLEEICTNREQKVKILLRVTPGIEAHTHDYILTGQEDSKFGLILLTARQKLPFDKRFIVSFWKFLDYTAISVPKSFKRPVSFWQPKKLSAS